MRIALGLALLTLTCPHGHVERRDAGIQVGPVPLEVLAREIRSDDGRPLPGGFRLLVHPLSRPANGDQLACQWPDTPEDAAEGIVPDCSLVSRPGPSRAVDGGRATGADASTDLDEEGTKDLEWVGALMPDPRTVLSTLDVGATGARSTAPPVLRGEANVSVRTYHVALLSQYGNAAAFSVYFSDGPLDAVGWILVLRGEGTSWKRIGHRYVWSS